MSKFLPIGTKGELLNSDMIARIIPNHRRAFQPLLYKALRRFFVQKG